MKPAPRYSRLVLRFAAAACLFVPLSFAQAEWPAAEDERTLHEAGLPADGPSLSAFFRARARTGIDPERIGVLIRQFAADSRAEYETAAAELLGLGALALPALRQTANDLDHPEVAARAAKCLPWLEGASSRKLLIAAARELGRRPADDAAESLLAYLPAADDDEVIAAVNAALAAVAAPAGKADPALLRGLSDPLGVRRAAACVALCSAAPPDRIPAVRKLLRDPAPVVRLRAALALAETHDAEAIPVLIDLLADLSAEQRAPVEEFLTRLAGEWAPVLQLALDDEVSRGIRRDTWSAWWRRTDAATLTAAFRKHTPTAEDRDKVRALIAQLGGEEFAARERASRDLFARGRMTLPQLREASKNGDPEIARRVRDLIERIEREPAHHLPLAAIRLLAVRKPAGAVETLLAFLPYAEDEPRVEEVSKSLTVLARREGKLDPPLVRALDDPNPTIRSIAAEVLAQSGTKGRTEVRKLLKDAAPGVRLRTALALARAKEREGVPALIDLLTVLPPEQVGQVEDALHQLAGDTAPEVSLGEKVDEKKKCRDAWAAWWKVNAARADLSRLTDHPEYGYTLICDTSHGRVYEIDRRGKERWHIDNLSSPLDARVLPGDRILIAEYKGGRVTERDFKGKILWQKQLSGNPINVQRLANGNTFIAMNGGAIMEVDRTGKEVYTIPNVPGNCLAACRARNSDIYCMTFNSQCLVMDATGKRLKSFVTNHDSSSNGAIDLLPNGRILLARNGQGKVLEYDREGHVLLELDAPQVRTASALPNGHILIASQGQERVYEMDRKGKIVWEHKNAGNAFRARQR